MHLNPTKAGLALGFVLAGFHLVWSILVVLGWGQPLIDFVLWAHMIHMTYIVGPFDAAAAGTLLVFTFVVGCTIGYVFAMVWNKLHKS